MRAPRAALRTMPIMRPLQPPWWSYDRHEPRLPCSHKHASKRPVLCGGKDGRWRLLLAATAAAAAGGDGGGGAGRPPPEGIVGQAGSRGGMMPAGAPLGLIGGSGGRSSERMTCGMGRSACAHGMAALLAREPGSVQCCAAGRKLQAAARDRASRRLARRRVAVDVSHLPISKLVQSSPPN